MPELIKTYRSPFYYLNLIFLLSCGYINGQEFYIEQFGPDDGLPSSETYHILQDSDGYFWICTDRGIVKYDTYDFTVYDNSTPGIDDHTFFKGYEFGDEIWFTAYNQTITIYNKKTKVFKTLKEHLPFLKNFGHIFKVVQFNDEFLVYFRKGSLAMKTSSSGNFELINLKKSILSKEKIITDSFEITSLNLPGSIKLVLSKYGIGGYLVDDDVYSTLELSNIRKRYFSGSIKTKFYFKNTIDSLEIISTSKGVFSLNKRSLNTLIRNIGVTSLGKDLHGTFWITTLNEGIANTSHLIQNIVKLPKTNSKITALNLVDNYLIAGTSKGDFYIINPKKSVLDKKFELSIVDYIYEMHNIKNSLWINGSVSLTYEENMGFVKKNIFLPRPPVTYTFTYPIQDKIILHHNFRGQRITSLWNSDENIPIPQFRENIKSICSFNNSHAFMATLNGLYKLDTVDLFSPKLLPIFPDTTVRINKIKNGSDFIAIASSGSGFAIYRNEKPFVYNGPISSPLINSMALVGDSLVYLGTNKGIDKIKMVHSDDSTGFEYICTYSNMDLLLSNFIYDLCYSKNKIWYSTDEGLAWFNIDDTIPIIPAPKMHIDYFSVLDSIIDDTIKVLSNNWNDIAIHFTGISTKKPKKNFYRYILEKNKIKSPIQYTDSREVRFNDLSYGNYVFYVSAQNYQGTWSEYKTVEFRIKPHLFQTFWFLFLLVLGFLGGVYLTYRYRLRQIQEREEGKNRMLQLEKDFNDAVLSSIQSQINPHFVFNALQSIQGYILKNDIETASDYLAKFSKIMRSGLEFSSLEFVSLEEEIEFLNNYLIIEKLRFPNRFNFKIVYDSDVLEEGIKIPPLVLQPIIENAVKHAFLENDEQNLILVSFEYLENKNVLRSIVEDNGIGFFNTKSVNFGHGQHISKGISLVNRRVDLLKQKYGQGSYGLLSRPNESGTKIVIELPIA